MKNPLLFLLKAMQTLEQRLSNVITFFLSGREQLLAQIAELHGQIAELTERYNSNLQEVTDAKARAEAAVAELQVARDEITRLEELAASDATQDATLDALLDSVESLFPPVNPIDPTPVVGPQD